MPSRRAFLAGLSGSALAATAGCISDLTDGASTGESLGLTDDRLAFRDGFEREAVALREAYDDHGVWGVDPGPGLAPAVEYVGAWVERWDVPRDVEGRPFARANAAAVVYRVGERRRLWLWVGARPLQPEGRLGRSNVARLSVGTEPGPGWESTAAAPRAPTRDGPVRVALDDRGPGARVPLDGGGLAADTFELGPEGRIEVAWQGISGDPRAAHAVVEYAPTDSEKPFAPPVSFGVAAAQGVL